MDETDIRSSCPAWMTADPVSMLRDATRLDLLDDGWVRRFAEMAERTTGSVLSTGWNALGCGDLPEKSLAELLTLMWHFLKEFDAPVPMRNLSDEKNDAIRTLLFPDEEEDDGESPSSQPRAFGSSIEVLVCQGLASRVADKVVLSLRAAGALFRGTEGIVQYATISNYARIVPSRSIANKELFFDDKSGLMVGRLRHMLSPSGFDRACRILERKGRPRCILAMLYGEPGTGKTEAVLQLARESGRDIVQVDITRLLGSDWGLSEHNFRSLFTAYRYIAAVSPDMPILLLNEAEQFLGRRFEAVRSIERSENTLVDIVLEELESMDGIVIATTNLVESMDPAFDRRFLFKVRIGQPDAAARARIWKSMIPELPVKDAERLGQNFEMTGAQIANVVARRDLSELWFDGDRGYGFIAQMCSEEIAGVVGGVVRRIGF